MAPAVSPLDVEGKTICLAGTSGTSSFATGAGIEGVEGVGYASIAFMAWSGVEGVSTAAGGGVEARSSLRGWIAGTRDGSAEYHLHKFFWMLWGMGVRNAMGSEHERGDDAPKVAHGQNVRTLHAEYQKHLFEVAG